LEVIFIAMKYNTIKVGSALQVVQGNAKYMRQT